MNLSPTLSPPEVAKRLGVKPEKVINWILSGRLRAINVSNGTRPRYRIDLQNLADFERSLSVVTAPKRQRRRKKDDDGVHDFCAEWKTQQ